MIQRTEAHQLVTRYADMLVRIAYSQLGNFHDAQDICQETLIKLIMQAPDFPTEEAEKAWVIRVAINKCRDHLRSAEHKYADTPLSSIAEPAAPNSAELSSAIQAVLELPEPYREAIHLYHVEGYSVQEIAAITNRSESAIYKSLSRGREKLREIMRGNKNE